MRSPYLSHVTDGSFEPKETTAGTVEEPEKLGVLAKTETLKNRITSENPLHRMPTPCPLGTAVRDAWRVERPGRVGEGAARKDSAVGVEF